MFTLRSSSLLTILALGVASATGQADTIITDIGQAPAQPEKTPSEVKAVANANPMKPPMSHSFRSSSSPSAARRVVTPTTHAGASPVVPTGVLHGTGRNTTIIVNTVPYPVYAPAYPTYPGYSAYGYGYPYGYPGNGYAGNSYGASVTISTPGFSNGTFTQFPSHTTVTAWGNSPYPGHCGTPYGGYPSYPAYPTYVPGHLSGYRGAAGVYQQNFGGTGYYNQSFSTGRR